jgi:cytochrome c oxidase assembly protein subunit 15
VSAPADVSVRRWLIASAAAVLLAVAVGGITRLTESGLSITEWRPVSGILPPRGAAEWGQAYRDYLAIPEARTVHRGITLDQFRHLYWWEWVHRLLARGVGLILALPYFVLLAQRKIRPEHRRRLLLLPLLAASQGALGWYMVQSGLTQRVDVSPYRLTAHLGLALAIYGVAVWTALDLRAAGRPIEDRTPAGLRSGLRTGVALTILTILSGGFVAGLDAGRIFNTFPLMGGRVVPPGYWMSGLGWLNGFENPVAAQFHHRVLALITAAALLGLAAAALRSGRTVPLRRAARFMAAAVIVQIALGIATLLAAVPVGLGVLHQIAGVGVLTAALIAAHTPGGPSAVTLTT